MIIIGDPCSPLCCFQLYVQSIVQAQKFLSKGSDIDQTTSEPSFVEANPHGLLCVIHPELLHSYNIHNDLDKICSTAPKSSFIDTRVLQKAFWDDHNRSDTYI